MDLDKALEKLAGKIGILEVNISLRELELQEAKEQISTLENQLLGNQSMLLSTQHALATEKTIVENQRVRLLEFETPKPRAKPRATRAKGRNPR